MKLKCVKTKEAHWGKMITEGNWYDVISITENVINSVSDYVEYFKYLGLVSSSIDWIRKGYNEDNLHEVIPGYMKCKDICDKFYINIKMPYVTIKGDDGNKYSYYTLTKDEIIQKFNLTNKSLDRKGEIYFTTSNYSVDEYFNYLENRRDLLIKNLGI